MEIKENLWQVGGAEYTSVEDAAIYLICFGEKAALIDAGCGGAHEQLMSNISEVLPSDVAFEYLFLTHCHYDHTGGAEAVRDQYGCRIVAHELDAVFKPFYRLDEARSIDDGGTGLGLPIARDIARSHGGDLLLETSPLGGLRAIVTIPG